MKSHAAEYALVQDHRQTTMIMNISMLTNAYMRTTAATQTTAYMPTTAYAAGVSTSEYVCKCISSICARSRALDARSSSWMQGENNGKSKRLMHC